MRQFSRALLAGGLGFASALLVACGGGSGLLSAGQSSALNSQLSAVAAAIRARHCTVAAAAAQGFDNAVANLTTVNPTLTDNLKQASSALAQQAGPECQGGQSAGTTPATTPATTPTTTPATTSTPTSPANTSTSTNPSTAPATTPTSPGTTTTTPNSGGAGIGGTGTSTGASGGAPPG